MAGGMVGRIMEDFINIIRGNSLETPNVWGLSSFHPNVSKQQPPPQCLGFVLFSPRCFYRAQLVSTWTPRQQLTGRGSHVAVMSAQGKTKKGATTKSKEIAAGREDSGQERRREGAAARGSGGFRCLPLSAVDSIVEDFHGEREFCRDRWSGRTTVFQYK